MFLLGSHFEFLVHIHEQKNEWLLKQLKQCHAASIYQMVKYRNSDQNDAAQLDTEIALRCSCVHRKDISPIVVTRQHERLANKLN